jgi:hypothetical protein
LDKLREENKMLNQDDWTDPVVVTGKVLEYLTDFVCGAVMGAFFLT